MAEKKPAPAKKDFPEKKETKAVKKGGKKAASVKAEPSKKKPVGKKIIKPKEIKKIAEKLKGKKKRKFRGRFGKKNIRKKSIKKWQKWRKPRGIDIRRNKEDGLCPKTGYGMRKELKFKHPSGYDVVVVENAAQLEKIVKEKEAVVVAGKVGKKKKGEIVKKASELGLAVLNR